MRMDVSPAPAGFEVSLDSKRRPTLPAALLAQARIEPGDDLIATAAGDGAILLRSRSTALAQLRDSFRAGFESMPAEGVVERLREDRMRDQDHSGARLSRQGSRSGDAGDAQQVAERGSDLLTELGL